MSNAYPLFCAFLVIINSACLLNSSLSSQHFLVRYGTRKYSHQASLKGKGKSKIETNIVETDNEFNFNGYVEFLMTGNADESGCAFDMN